jgi:hypothetical protein
VGKKRGKFLILLFFMIFNQNGRNQERDFKAGKIIIFYKVLDERIYCLNRRFSLI